MPVVTDYTALLSGKYWNGIEVTGKPVIVTYSFPTTAAAYVADVDGFTPETVASFQAFTAAEQAQARAALGEWAAASGLIFVEVAPGQGDINFQLVDLDTTSSPSYAGAGGIGFYPFGNWDFFTYPSFSGDLDSSGDVFMSTQFASGGEVSYGTLLHEIGHAIGLKHPTEIVTNFAANPIVTHDQVLASDDPALTIMAEVGGPGIPDHLKALDQQAAAFLYGPAGTGQVVTGNASGANAVVSSWSWNATKQRLTQSGFSGDDTIRGSSVKDVVNGLDGNDRLFGLNGNDVLNGGAGNDLLNGGPGRDVTTGGAGDDTYMVDDARDKVIELAGEGFDSVLAGVTYTLSADVELLQLFGAGLTGIGNDLGNTMFGDGTLGNKLKGLGGDDYMVAGSGNDTLDGGAGVDMMFGGAGNDIYFVDDGSDSVREDAGPGVDAGGLDTVRSSASYGLGDFVEDLTLTGTAAIDGTGNGLDNSIKGNNAVNHLLGGGGNDSLEGGSGADVLDGGEDSDTYYVDATDVIQDSGTSGTDTIKLAGASYVMTDASGVENLSPVVGNTRNLNITGNSLANRLSGNDSDNTLRGMAGDDALLAGLGNDKLEGGSGRDQLTGGDGVDRFIFKAGDSPATSAPLAYDTILDFVTGTDRIDLDTVTGGPPVASYSETSAASNNFSTLLGVAAGIMADGIHQQVFVAGLTDGWLFWNTDADPQTPDQAVRLIGVNDVSLFQVNDLM